MNLNQLVPSQITSQAEQLTGGIANASIAIGDAGACLYYTNRSYNDFGERELQESPGCIVATGEADSKGDVGSSRGQSTRLVTVVER